VCGDTPKAMPGEKRLQRAKAYLLNVGTTTPLEKTEYLLAAAEIDRQCGINDVVSVLEKPRWKNQSPRKCFEQFRNSPQAVRNWRILWHCLPRGKRAEQLA
jgi:hypothetical protein